jgi:hypothetical protein
MTMSAAVIRIAPFVALASTLGCSRPRATPDDLVWLIEDPARVGGHPAMVIGTPRAVDTDRGRAVCFNGADTGLALDVNPLERLAEFTVQVLLKPDPDGAAEQRFLHFSEDGGDNRVLLETRTTPDGQWYLDTYLHKGTEKLALIQPDKRHPSGTWYWVALTYRDQHMWHFVNGVEEAKGDIAFAPLGPGKMSLGVRLNRVSWFKGCIHELRVSHAALAPDQLQRP